MADTGWIGAGTVADVTAGFNNQSNAQGNPDGLFAGALQGSSPVTVTDSVMRLYDAAGSLAGDNKADGQAWATTATNLTMEYGGDGELWGLSLGPADVNDADFGFYWDTDNAPTLKANNYGFAVPGAAIITGIAVRVTGGRQFVGPSWYYTVVDSFEIKIFYTTDFEISGGGEATGVVFGEAETKSLVQKEYQFKVFNKGSFLGEWDEVANDPEYKEQLNTIGTQLPIKLGRNIDNLDPIPEELVDQTGDTLTTQDGGELSVVSEGGAGLGAGSDADVNYDIEIISYYGGYEHLITEAGDVLVTQDFEPFIVTDGAPEGQNLFTGFIANWETNYGGDEAIDATLFSYGWELNQIILETAAETVIDEDGNSGTESFGAKGAGGTDKLRQTVTAPSTGKVNSIVVKGLEMGYIPKGGGSATITLEVYGGTAHTGTPLASASKQIYSNEDGDFASFEEFAFYFADYIDWTSGNTYSLVLKSSATDINTDGSLSIYALTTSGYAGGTLSTINGAGTATDTGSDLSFAVSYAGGETTVPFNSYDPSDIMRAIIDFAASKGAHIQYTADSIEQTGTTVSFTFKTNTISEAINKVLELAPSDWYFYIDPADNTLYFKPRPTVVDHLFVLGDSIAQMTIKRDMENIVNEAYFTGGGDPALLLKTVDQTSLDEWRRGLAKISDNRVTDSSSAAIISESHINRNKDPQYTVTLVVPASRYDIETIQVGQLAGFANTGNFIDDLELQIMEKQYSKTQAVLVCGSLRPQVSKRVEDIKRNLDILEQQNNPASPA